LIIGYFSPFVCHWAFGLLLRGRALLPPGPFGAPVSTPVAGESGKKI
jgi:hypothetical protein